MIEEPKPQHVKPAFYAFLYGQLKDIAKLHGYNLVLHGSMNRDLDLIAIQWADDCSEHLTVLQEFETVINGFHSTDIKEYHPSVLGGGRTVYVININRQGRWNNYIDAKYYLDISFTPQLNKR